MGLTVAVGIPEEDLKHDESRQQYAADFKLITRILKAARVPAHQEPLPAPEEWCWSTGLGYSSLHFLRRLGAHLALHGTLPVPLKRNGLASEAPEIQMYLANRQAGGQGRAFDHLLLHSDADGYYLPVDFPQVLNQDGAAPLTGGLLGSAVRLWQECQALAERLELRGDWDFDFDDDDEWKRRKKATRGAVWHQYPIEASVCAVLLKACKLSVEHQAAIVFC